MNPSSLPRPLVAVCGWSGSGKTTLIEAVVPRLVDRGLRVAVVKHDAHGVQIDRPGKDSDRLFRAGADVILRGPGEIARRFVPGIAADLESVVDELQRSHDVVLVEGHKSTPLPKVWCGSADRGVPPEDVASVMAVLPWDSERRDLFEQLILESVETAHRSRPILGGLLVGGHSHRMGRPKQLLAAGRRTLGEIAAESVGSVASPVVLLGAGEVAPGLHRLLRLPDPPGVEGPLAGLTSALRWAPHATWLVAACDMPWIAPRAVEWLLGQRRPGRWAVLPRTADGRLQPLLAVYEPQAAQLVEGLIRSGNPAPRLLAQHEAVASPTVPEDLERHWGNVNTPQQWDRVSR
jgi:molybdopterin-guanine dinucleotide biosynthesis protein A